MRRPWVEDARAGSTPPTTRQVRQPKSPPKPGANKLEVTGVAVGDGRARRRAAGTHDDVLGVRLGLTPFGSSEPSSLLMLGIGGC